MELFRNANYDFLGRKWLFMGGSVILLLVGLVSLGLRAGSWRLWQGVPLGVDFKGGTLVYVKFSHPPNEDKIRADMQAAGLSNARIQRYGAPGNNEVIIALEQRATTEEALDQGKLAIIQALGQDAPAGKLDLNNTGTRALQDRLLARDPLRAGSDAAARYAEIAKSITDYRDQERGGVLSSVEELKGRVDAAVLQTLQEEFFVSDFGVRNVEIVGAQVGAQLRRQALLATLYSLAGMLIYIAVRFEPVYGAAAVVAVFHDTLITVGAFSVANKEISLTVIAAILTLVGYSMNDTIVIFDRVRENLKLMRRAPLAEVMNRSINQTLSRTILTSGLTFLTVLSLYLFGGEVLNGFSFALVVGILVGTYSSFGIAAPLVVLYYERKAQKEGRGPVAVAGEGSKREREKIRAKA
ncbi:MAG TPA: protein translocase subunit SecF [Terriglobales bacterium]|nr:protein translocase subunit SecF [Terriglobales bacterium]